MPPHVNGFTPQIGRPGTIVKIAGEHLDRVISIEFTGGVSADFTLFKDTMLKVAVPAGAETGPILLRDGRSVSETPAWFRVIVPSPGALALAPARPNPGRGPFAVAFNLPESDVVHLGVFDVRGRRVADLANGPLAAGGHERVWDARGTNGGRVAPGLYFVRLRLRNGAVTRPIVVLD